MPSTPRPSASVRGPSAVDSEWRLSVALDGLGLPHLSVLSRLFLHLPRACTHLVPPLPPFLSASDCAITTTLIFCMGSLDSAPEILLGLGLFSCAL